MVIMTLIFLIMVKLKQRELQNEQTNTFSGISFNGSLCVDPHSSVVDHDAVHMGYSMGYDSIRKIRLQRENVGEEVPSSGWHRDQNAMKIS